MMLQQTEYIASTGEAWSGRRILDGNMLESGSVEGHNGDRRRTLKWSWINMVLWC